jgi:hypothetical protein
MKEIKMKTQTAMDVIFKEAKFLGMSIVDVMKDVQKNGRVMYNDRVIEAVKVITNMREELL